jgi:predicted ATPase
MSLCLTFIPVTSAILKIIGVHRLQGNFNQSKVQIIARQLRDEFKILCLDEFQVIDIADAMMLRNLISEMAIKNDIKMFLTSNREPSKLYDRGIQRESFFPCIRLIEKEFIVLGLSSQDYRLKGVGLGQRILSDKEEFNKTMLSLGENCTPHVL